MTAFSTTETQRTRRSAFLNLRALRVSVVSLLLVGFVTLPQTASACAVCFGDPDSPLAKGLNWAVLSLLAIVLLVLGGIAAFFTYLVKRARMSQITAPQEELQP